jgi:hypothetical protein
LISAVGRGRKTDTGKYGRDQGEADFPPCKEGGKKKDQLGVKLADEKRYREREERFL